MRKSNFFSTVLTLFLLVPASIIWAQSVSLTGIVYENNTAKIPFTVPEGKITVQLPDDAGAGGRITGTVLMEPTGKNEKQKQKNLDLLKQYGVKIANWDIPSNHLSFQPAGKPGTAVNNFNLPDMWWGTLQSFAPVSLLSMKQPVAKAEIPLVLSSQTISGQGSGDPVPQVQVSFTFEKIKTGYEIQKKVINSGENIVLQNNKGWALDELAQLPDFSYYVNDKPVAPLCSSPRQIIIAVPPGTIGKTSITAKDKSGKAVFSVEIHVVDISASIDKKNLRSMERTNMHVSVEGLKDCPYPVSMVIVNNSSETILLDKGVHQTYHHVPAFEYVKDDVTVPSLDVHQGVTGVVPGAYNITANLILPTTAFGDVFHQQKSVLKTPEDYNAWADALKKDLKAYADKQGNDEVGRAAKANAQRAIDNIPKCHDKNKLEECKAFADAYLRPVNVPKGAATMWVCGFEAYKAAIKAITGTLGGKPELIDWEVIKNGLEFIRNMGEQLNDEGLQNGANDIKKMVETIQKAGETKEKLEKLNDSLEELNDRIKKEISNNPSLISSYKMEDLMVSTFMSSIPGYRTMDGTKAVLNIGNMGETGIYSINKSTGGTYEMQIGPEWPEPVFSWIRSTAIPAEPVKFSITGQKPEGATPTLDFNNALITSIEFPKMDVAGKEIAALNIIIRPEEIKFSAGTENVKPTDTKEGKRWMPSNFKIELGDLPCKKINKVESFKITQKTTEEMTGDLRQPIKVSGRMEYPNITFYVPEIDIQPWNDWYNNFTKNNELKTGDINYVNEKGEFLFSVPMKNVTPRGLINMGDGNYSITVQPGNVEINYDTKPGENLFKPGDTDKVKDLEDSLRKIKDELEQKKRERDITIDDEIKKAEKEKRDCEKELEEAKKKAAAAAEALEKAKQKKENIEKNIGPGKTFPDKDAAKKHFGDYEKEYDDAKKTSDAANINLAGLKKKCPELTKALEKLKNRKTEVLPGEIEKGEKDVKELGEELEREKTKAEEEIKRLDDEQKRKEELERQKTQAEKDAQDAKFRTKAENVYLLQNIYSLGLISSKIWEIPGLMDWLPDALEKPIGDAVEDLGKTTIPLDAITAIGGLYNVVAAMLDPCTAEGSKTTIRRLKGMKNSKTGNAYTDDEAMDKTERMCELLKKLKAIAAAAKK